MMLDPSHPIAKLLEKDPRYKLEAYVFVFEALNYAHKSLGMGTESTSEPLKQPPRKRKAADEDARPERHLSGQQLCEAIRVYALEQFGYMAKCVLNSWGVTKTGDFGEIVFNLIAVEQMRKTKEDRREDFDDVFDFDAALCKDFKIVAAE